MELQRVIYPETKASHNSRIPSGGERSETIIGLSFTAIASGSRRNIDGGIVKGKEIISEGIPDFKDDSKSIANLNQLTINMGSGDLGRDMGDSGLVQLSINLQLRCGLNGE